MQLYDDDEDDELLDGEDEGEPDDEEEAASSLPVKVAEPGEISWDTVRGVDQQTIGYFTGKVAVENTWWLGGYGPTPNRVMFVFSHPTEEDFRAGLVCGDAEYTLLKQQMAKTGVDLGALNPYITSAVKYVFPEGQAPAQTDIAACRHSLYREIEKVKPELIVCFGSNALDAVAHKIEGKRRYLLTEWRGVPFTPEQVPGSQVLALWHPSQLVRRPDQLKEFRYDLGTLRQMLLLLNNSGAVQAVESPMRPWRVIDTPEKLTRWRQRYKDGDQVCWSLDSEWLGKHPRDKQGMLRCLQLDEREGPTWIFRFLPTLLLDGKLQPQEYGENDPRGGAPGDWVFEEVPCVDILETMAVLQDIANRCSLAIIGQHLPADGEWLLHYGFDIRPYSVYDTMLAEHLINNAAEKDLMALTTKYAPTYGRYDLALNNYVGPRKRAVIEYGYGFIPESILFPYAAADVQVCWPIMDAQLPALEEGGYMEPTGVEKEHCSMLDTVMNLAAASYELQNTGLLVDMERLQQLTKLFNDRREQLLSMLKEAARAKGLKDFNPSSAPQKAKFLFGPPEEGGLGLTPVRSTKKSGNAPWERVALQTAEDQATYKPAVDKLTLNILKDQHPTVKLMAWFEKINTVCKNLLPRPPHELEKKRKKASAIPVKQRAKGIIGNVWGDGRIHSVFLQLTDTGRMNTKKPNCQNFPKAAEGELAKIFAGQKDEIIATFGVPKKPEEWLPPIRSVFVPPPGHVYIEADYKQAELFVLAGMSGDTVLLDVLTTPGKDLHDRTTIDSFHVQVAWDDGTPYNEEAMLELAKTAPKLFKDKQKHLIYITERGDRLTRDQFKDTLRVSGKSINFGIPYGRGPTAIALQVLSETGQPVTVDEIKRGIDGWKRRYSTAWRYMERCQEQAVKEHFVLSAWGRRRSFPVAVTRAQEGKTRREGSNFPIQATVADTVSKALHNILTERTERRLQFLVCNQKHDALQFEVPESEIAEATDIIKRGMTGILIPMMMPMRLGVDLEVVRARPPPHTTTKELMCAS